MESGTAISSLKLFGWHKHGHSAGKKYCSLETLTQVKLEKAIKRLYVCVKRTSGGDLHVN